jgi:hypothetical protein
MKLLFACLTAVPVFASSTAGTAATGNEGPASAIIMKPLDGSTVSLIDVLAQNQKDVADLMQLGTAICQAASGFSISPPGSSVRTVTTEYRITVCESQAGGAPALPSAALDIVDRATYGTDMVTHAYTRNIQKIQYPQLTGNN